MAGSGTSRLIIHYDLQRVLRCYKKAKAEKQLLRKRENVVIFFLLQGRDLIF
jgi:hypothetical protein